MSGFDNSKIITAFDQLIDSTVVSLRASILAIEDEADGEFFIKNADIRVAQNIEGCLLYTSDAADE